MVKYHGIKTFNIVIQMSDPGISLIMNKCVFTAFWLFFKSYYSLLGNKNLKHKLEKELCFSQ